MRDLELLLLLGGGTLTGLGLSWWTRIGDAALASALPCIQAAIG